MMRKMNSVLDDLIRDKATLGLIVRAFRKRVGLTQEELAKVTGIKRNNISAIENDRIDITKHYAEILAAALNLHPNDLLYPEGQYKMSERARAVHKNTQALLKKKSRLPQ